MIGRTNDSRTNDGRTNDSAPFWNTLNPHLSTYSTVLTPFWGSRCIQHYMSEGSFSEIQAKNQPSNFDVFDF